MRKNNATRSGASPSRRLRSSRLGRTELPLAASAAAKGDAGRRASFRGTLEAVCVDCPNRAAEPSPRVDSSLGPLVLPPRAEQAIAELANCRLLTPREQEVLTLCCAGLKNGAIALALGISPSAVRRHLRHLHRKTRTHDKVELILNLWHSCAAACTSQLPSNSKANSRTRRIR